MQKTDKDDFWDVGKLLPKRKAVHGVRFDTSAVDVSDGMHVSSVSSDTRSEEGDDSLKLNFKRGAVEESERLIREYCPDNAFIKKVGVYTSPSAYRYYEDFRQTMHKYLRLTVKEAERVPFFSYVPQYSQLSSQRLAWYLFWRSGCRRREYMQTDFSYVLLYIFELINFENPKHPDKIIEELCSLWRAYREEFWQLDKYLPDWVCDYCLIHGVRLPYDIVSDFISDVLDNCSYKTFYIGEGDRVGLTYGRVVVMSASGYNYKKSKFYTGEYKKLFDLHVPLSASGALGLEGDRENEGKRECVLTKREVYVGALCTSEAKRTLYIEHYPLARSNALKSEATLALKYAENKLRAVLGIRSRLAVVGIPEKIKAEIDRYFAAAFPSEHGHNDKRSEEPDYMAYYDSDTSGIKYEHAADIERDSWETAAMMCESFGDDGESFSNVQEPERSVMTENTLCETQLVHTDVFLTGEGSVITGSAKDEYEALAASLEPSEREILVLLLQKRQKDAQRVSIERGSFLSADCEKINSAALEHIADILIECVEGEYIILPDYEREVRECLQI